ncbi:PEPxxWA-CTERM sorting domain-containing protein [Sphingomonas azotifigens]|uniref:PEPxxWA-CTERM sorting domain-containing protein n=1 Tax=Sphingomonas azotifigens TaxID=330920 RepID=UPI001FE46F7F|nr:PEPxxWA-CTERM sorting domain-containing protein [Sphingomonas azotifigens]
MLSTSAEAGTTSHVRTVTGRATGGVGPFGCATSGPQNDIRNWFSAAVFLPTEGYATCHLQGSTINNSGPAATTATSSAISTDKGNTATAAASAHADYTRMGAAASSSVTGGPYEFNYHTAEGVAFVSDTLNVDASGNQGFIKLGFAIDGTMHVGPSGQAFVDFAFQFGNGPIWSAMSATISQQGGTNFRADYTPGFKDYSQSNSDFSIDGTVFTRVLPVTFGQSVDVTYGLFASAASGLYGSGAESAFGSTVRLTSIAVTDAKGKPIDFSISSASGTRYDAQGAHALPTGVPEPGSWALLILGFGAAGATLRRTAPTSSLRARYIFR